MEGFLPEGFDLFPRLSRIKRFVGRVLFGHGNTLASHGNHFVTERGASAELDAALYDDVASRWDEANVVEHVDFQGVTRLVPRFRECPDERFDNVIELRPERPDGAA